MAETQRERIVVDKTHQLDYKLLTEMVRKSGGWLRVGASEGEQAEVWHDDKVYVFSGEGLIGFLYAVKDVHTENLYAAVDLCDYIEKSERQAASVFVRDAIAARARELKAKIKGDGNG